jgi:hypothetical protein
LIKETEAILDAEKKKLEWKQNKTQEEKEALVDLNITYKLTGGGKDAWKDVPILFVDDRQRYTNLVNSSVTNKDQEILELKEQIQLLKQEKSILIGQTKELPPIKHEDSNFQLEIKESDRQIALLRNDFQLLQHKNVTFQQQINANDIKMASLQRENQELQLKTKKLQKENKRLKQNANSRETRPSSSTTVPESTTSSSTTVPEPTTSNTDINEDDPNNDFNYDTECGTEYSSSDDTSSEDGDRANDLNYDSDV